MSSTDGQLIGICNRRSRLSSLDDDLLLHILTFLPVNDAVKISLVAVRFRSLWTLLPSLHFQNPRQGHLSKFRRFISSTDTVILLHSRPNLNRFHLDFERGATLAPFDIYSWIQFAVGKNVEDLHLNFLPRSHAHRSADEPLVLPLHLLEHSSLQKLSLCFCKFPSTFGEIRWGNLKALSLGYLDLDDGLMGKILGGCRVLEELELSKCGGSVSLHIGSTSLRRLGIRGDGYVPGMVPESEPDPELVISSPGLLVLRFSGSFRMKLRLVDVTSLVEAHLDFVLKGRDGVKGYNDDSYTGCREYVDELLKGVAHVEKLSVGTWPIRVLSISSLMLQPPSPPMLRCRTILLHTCLTKWDIPGISSLMMVSSEKQCVRIQFDCDCHWLFCFDPRFQRLYDVQCEASGKDGLKHIFSNVKSMEVDGFKATEYEMNCIRLMVGRGSELEKLTIRPPKRPICCEEVYGRPDSPGSSTEERYQKPVDLLNVARELLELPRASTKAVIRLL